MGIGHARRRVVAWFGVALVVSGLLPAGDAAAHATLEASIPAPSSVLEEAPEAIVLRRVVPKVRA